MVYQAYRSWKRDHYNTKSAKIITLNNFNTYSCISIPSHLLIQKLDHAQANSTTQWSDILIPWDNLLFNRVPGNVPPMLITETWISISCPRISYKNCIWSPYATVTIRGTLSRRMFQQTASQNLMHGNCGSLKLSERYT